MKKNDTAKSGHKTIDEVLSSLSSWHRAPCWVFALLIAIFLIAAVSVNAFATSKEVIHIGGGTITFYSFAGVFSSLGSICLIFMALYFGKTGYLTALCLQVAQLPMMLMGMLKAHNYNSIPGFFSTLLSITTITIIYFTNIRIKKYQSKIQDQAVTDRLTGLPNRFACSELIDELIRRNEKFALVSIDLNDFKSINDTMGYNTGNAVLIEISSRWKTIADMGISGTLDFITRVNGDEFSLIIRNYHTENDILKTIRHYESVLSNRLTIDDCDFYITASFGYTEFPKDTDNGDALITYADAAMYEVKRNSSSNHVIHFTPEMLRLERTIELEREIRTSLDNDSISFKLQPQYDISHRLRGFEALARMNSSTGESIAPTEFIPIAEKVGLIDKVDGCVFRKSAKFFGELINKTGAKITLSVNISVRHLMKKNFINEVMFILEKYNIPAEQLEIEITESIMIDSAEKALNCINEIKNMGVKIAIDDFGTGYSSLSYLNKFPADLLKVDKSFIDKMNSSESSKQYVAAIISIGHIMGFDVISEGVEQEEQLETLRSIGWDYIQGFLWGQPLLPEEAQALVENYVRGM